MSHSTQRIAPCRLSVNATLSADQVGAEREKIVSSWQRGVRIDGFRKGKAPRPLVERRFQKEIEDDLTEGLVRSAFTAASEAEKFRPAGPLEIKRSEIDAAGGFTMEAELDVYPEVELPDVAGFTPPPFEVEPTDEEVEAAIEQLRERQAAWEPVEEGAAEPGMLVEAEVWGTPGDGSDEFHEERSLFVIGQGEVFPEIETAVTGHAAGEELSAERTLGPEAGERQGVAVSYRMKIKSLRRKRLPEIDDALASSLGVADLAALRERVRERLRHEKERAHREADRVALVDFLSDGRELPLPDRVLREETRRDLINLYEGFARRGIDPEKHVDWQKLEPEVTERVTRRLRAEILLDALAESLGIVVVDRDVDREVERQSRALGVPFAELKGNLAKQDGLGRIREALRRERAIDAVLARANQLAP